VRVAPSAQRGRVLQYFVARFAFQRLGQTEVQYFHLAIGPLLHVRGFQIAVNDAALMRVFEPASDLLSKQQCFLNGKRFPLDSLGQSWPVNEFHDQRASAVRFFQPVKRSNVRTIERGRDSRLALEAQHGIVSRYFVYKQALLKEAERLVQANVIHE